MNRNQVLKIAMIVCAAVLICSVAVTATGIFGQISGYADAEKYTAGDAEIAAEVKNLDINWTSGKVTVAYHGKSTVELRETSRTALGGDQKMRWLLDGDTLRVQYSRPGLRIFGNPEKELTVILPEGTELKTAGFSLTSGNLIIPGLKAESLNISATSGDISAEAETDSAGIGTTSGNIALKLKGRTESVKAGSTSGSILVEAEETGTINAGSTSGNIEVRADASRETKIGATSGTIRVRLLKTERLEVGTTSGDVTAALPTAPGFTAKIDTVSGSVDTAAALVKNGKEYSCGDGSARISIGTTSGDVRIEAAE